MGHDDEDNANEGKEDEKQQELRGGFNVQEEVWAIVYGNTEELHVQRPKTKSTDTESEEINATETSSA